MSHFVYPHPLNVWRNLWMALNEVSIFPSKLAGWCTSFTFVCRQGEMRPVVDWFTALEIWSKTEVLLSMSARFQLYHRVIKGKVILQILCANKNLRFHSYLIILMTVSGLVISSISTKFLWGILISSPSHTPDIKWNRFVKNRIYAVRFFLVSFFHKMLLGKQKPLPIGFYFITCHSD